MEFIVNILPTLDVTIN